jgi:phage terminase Nu1 subunit (DNA packaging protein)
VRGIGLSLRARKAVALAGSYAHERAALLAEKRAIAAMERKRLAGELVPVSQIEPAMLALANAVKTRLLVIPAKLAPQLAAMSTPAEIATLLQDEIHEALAELSRMAVVTNGDGDEEAIML